MHRAGITVGILLVLAACGSREGDLLNPQEAARLLHQACGVSFAADPVVISSTSADSEVSATVVLPDSDAESALKALRDNLTLHSRGQSETRYSYESFPEARAQAACELDTSLKVLYFRYTE